MIWVQRAVWDGKFKAMLILSGSCFLSKFSQLGSSCRSPNETNLENLRASMIVRSFDLSFDHEVKDVEVLMPWLLQRLVRLKKGDLLGGLLEAKTR